ncbi:Alpha/Beta hydrolase protein [Lipomyces starkeyi]
MDGLKRLYTSRMVYLSVKEGMPVIIVSIHYRVNWQGFLACQDQIDEAKAFGEAPSNFGLDDQRVAFQWVQKYIAGFGGHGEEIAAFVLLLRKTNPMAFEICGIDEEDPERLQKLRNVQVEKLVEGVDATGVLAFGPLADKGFFPEMPDCLNEARLFEKCDWVKDIIGPTTVPTHNLITTLSASPEAKNKRLYRCNVTLRNPFPGTPFYAVAGHHFVEFAFQFMTLLERYPHPQLQETSIEFARRLIAFANGKAPWREFDERGQAIAVVSSGDGWKTLARAEDEVVGPLTEEGGRRYRAWETVQNERTGKSGQVLYEVLDVPKIITLTFLPLTENAFCTSSLSMGFPLS